jgi:hypothetical protein
LVVPGVLGITLFALLLAWRVLHRLPQVQTNESLHRWLNLHWNLTLITALNWDWPMPWCRKNRCSAAR